MYFRYHPGILINTTRHLTEKRSVRKEVRYIELFCQDEGVRDFSVVIGLLAGERHVSTSA